MNQRRGLGEDPLDLLIPQPGQQQGTKVTADIPGKPPIPGKPSKQGKPRKHRSAAQTLASAGQEEATAQGADRSRISFDLPTVLVNELRDAAVALLRVNPTATLVGIVEDALRAELERLRSEHNSGKPFPRRPVSKLRPGRRQG